MFFDLSNLFFTSIIGLLYVDMLKKLRLPFKNENNFSCNVS